MAHAWQNARNAKARYESGNAISGRNAALALARSVGAIRSGDALAAQFANHQRVTSLADYCTNGEASGAQIDAGREPFLLVEDVYNPGRCLSVSIYDRRIEAIEAKTGLCWIDLNKGEALMRPDTLVYWKG